MSDKSWEERIAEAREEEEKINTEVEEPKEDVEEREDIEPKEELQLSEGFDNMDIDDELLAKAFEEEKEEVKEEDNVPDLSAYLFHTTENINDLQKTLDEKIDLPADTLSDILDDEKEHLTKLAKIIVNYTKRAELERRHILAGIETIQLVADAIPDKTSQGKKFDKNKTVVLSGEEAIMNVAARVDGLRKVFLIHSGFYIVLKKLASSEIREILRYIDSEGNELGRILGMHYYTVDDIIVVQKFSEILKMITVDSNLKDWRKGNNLIDCISYLDFDVIIASVCAQLYRNGVKHEMVCPKIECKYQEPITLDITKTKLIDTSKLPEEALHILLAGKPFDKVKCKAYQKVIGAYREVEVRPNMTFTLKVPSISTFISYGSLYIAKLVAALYSDNRTPEQQDIARYRIINYYKMFLPWIEKLTIKDPEDESTIVVRDYKGYEQLLEKDVWANNKNIKNFMSFFSDAKIVHFGFLGQECPVCHCVPDPNTNGFLPLDIRSFFFNLLVYQNQKDIMLSNHSQTN